MKRRGRGWARALRDGGAISFAAMSASFGTCWAQATDARLDLTLPIDPISAEESPASIGEAAPAFTLRGRFAASGETDELSSAEGNQLLTLGSDESVARRLSLDAKDLAVDYGTLDVSFAAVSQSTADTLTLDRLMQSGEFDGTDVQATYVATKLQLFDRITIGSRFAMSDWHAAASTAFRDGSIEAGDKRGGAMWHDLNAKLYDDGELRWSLSAQLGVVDVDYRAPSGMRLAGSPIVPGMRTYLMSRLQSGDLSLSLAQQEIDGPLRDLRSARATLGFGGGQLTVYQRDTKANALAQSEAVGSVGITAELCGGDLLEGMPALARWAPELISVTAESIDDRKSASGAMVAASGSTVSAVMSWKTDIGETGLTYWRKSLSVAASGSIEDDQILDVSYQLSLGPWRASFGVSYEAFIADDADRGLSGHASLGYAPSGGPAIKFGIDRHQDETLFDGDLMPQQTTGLDLAASIDLTPYLRSSFDWGQTNAKVEYRRELRADRIEGDAADAVTEALLASFATPL